MAEPRRRIPTTATTWVVAFLAIPIVAVWLSLAAIIIYSATSDPIVLDKIEGLLTALAVLTVPVMKIIDSLMDKWKTEHAE